MGSELLLGWCSRCYQLSVPSSDSLPGVFTDGYLSCQLCPGICLRLPADVAEYAVPASAFLLQPRTKPVRLAEFGRVIGQARAQHARQPDSDPVATVTAVAPCLTDLLIGARDRDELDTALFALWLVIGHLLVTTEDPAVVGHPEERKDSTHLTSLRQVITELTSTSR